MSGDGEGGDGGDGPDAGAADVPPGALTLFVTAERFGGNLLGEAPATSGLAAGDALCAGAASAADLDGSFVAWLSDNDTNALDRVSAEGPWVSTDDTLLFGDRDELMAGPRVPIDRDERGFVVAPSAVWTGTGADGGTGNQRQCENWSGTEVVPMVLSQATVGDTSQVGESWTFATNMDCDQVARLYCFEIQ